MTLHEFTLRVYYEDTDSMGVVYYANYLKFAERARTEFLRTCGWQKSDTPESLQAFVVRQCRIRYLRPARLDDMLCVKTEICHGEKTVKKQKKLPLAIIPMVQKIFRDAQLLARLDVELVGVTGDGRPCVLPPDLQQFFDARDS